MPSPIEYPFVDPVIQDIIKNLPTCDQVQYSSRDQLLYLASIAQKLGLYDAHDIINKFLIPQCKILQWPNRTRLP